MTDHSLHPAAGQARIAPLAVLPLFFPLSGRPVLLAGGSNGAAWKAELLMAAGAEVHLVTPLDTLDAAMSGLLARAPAAGALHHHDRVWGEADFAGMALALADLETETEAAAFHAAAQCADVPANVIDKAEYCDFQFGAIVNRSPVIVGISTDGAAPILAQAIRRRVEAILPLSLADWAGLAQRLRGLVNRQMAAGPRRRRFWERFTERAFGPAPRPLDERQLQACLHDIATAELGEARAATLIEGAFGDPEELTLKTVRALQSADIVLFDRSVSPGVLELARREATRIALGSSSNASARAAGLAATGRRVVCLTAASPSPLRGGRRRRGAQDGAAALQPMPPSIERRYDARAGGLISSERARAPSPPR